MDAIVYLRISQDRTGEQAGVGRQRDACLQRCEERGWTVVAVEQDNDVSAAGKRRRPGFEAMLNAIENGRAQFVVAWDLTRLQRNRRDELRLYEACKAAEAGLSLINGPELDFRTATGRLVADQLGSLARYEIELKSDRQAAAQAQAARKGRRSGGRRPFGYESDGLKVREVEAQAIREGYAAVLAGESLGEVARRWNAAGLLPEQKRYAEGHKGSASQWRRDSVRVVLLNPRNVARRAYKGEVVADAVWPPIVDVPTFEAVRAVLTNPDRRRRTATSARRLLSGVAVCGLCGATVHAGGTTRPGVANYRCSGSTGHFARMAEPVEDYVARIVVARLSMADARELVSSRDHPDADRLLAESNGIRERLDWLAAQYAVGQITDSQLATGTKILRERDAEIQATLADAGKVDVLGPLIAAEDVQEQWDGLSTSSQRRAIDTLMTVTIYPPGRGTRTFRPETVTIEWKV
ncbi:recombinase family protein [Sinomonas sp. ASV486]|uniref:recombinase family protein n=1 Tax=Sinomonas sp. ASV486 TaxID=3051170 RepID=UPI0027DAB58D|nr:recombinase family protein [Sinomonas sp. ASV486]MDQ4490711.1 recombinase family protein [Sinomonas sp. ASV486]